MKQFKLFLALLVGLFACQGISAQTQAENDAAVAAIEAGEYYYITTYYNGTSDGSVKYYLKTDGYLTDNKAEAGSFKFNTVVGLYTGFKFNCYFTNPELSGGDSGDIVEKGHLRLDPQNRDDWEAQAFFLSEGKFAVRATNANSTSWGANTYWTVKPSEASLPEAGYQLDAKYIWNVEVNLDPYYEVRAKVLALAEQEVYTGGQTAKTNFNAAVRTIDVAVAASTKASEVTSAIAQLREKAAEFISAEDIVLIEGKGFDLTEAFITNPTPTANSNGWTVTLGTKGNNWAGNNYDEGNNCAEFWQYSNSSIKQTINNLPSGYYMLTAQAFQRDGSASYALGNNTQWALPAGVNGVNNRTTAGQQFDEGLYKEDHIFDFSAGALTIGIATTESSTDNWTVWRGLSLKYFKDSDPVLIYKSKYEEALDAANQAIQDFPFKSSQGVQEIIDLQAAIDDAPEYTIESYTEKAEALVAKTEVLNGVAPTYTEFGAECIYANKLGLAPLTIVSPIISGAPITAAKAQEATITLKLAEFALVDEYPIDVTDKLGEWTDDNIGLMNSQHWDGNNSSQYVEQAVGWNQDSWTALRKQTVKLPAGDYMLKFACRKSENAKAHIGLYIGNGVTSVEFPIGGSGKGIDTSGKANYGEGTFANDGNGYGWQWKYITFSLDEETEVGITYSGSADTRYQWMGYCNMQLLTKAITATIGDTGYATLYYSNVNLSVPEGVTASFVSNVEGNQVELTPIDAIPAGEGVILQGEPGNYTFKPVADPDLIKNNMLRGSDEEALTEGEGLFYMLSLAEGGAEPVGFYWGAADGAAFTNGAHKAYLVVPVSEAAGVRAFFFGGEATGINGVENKVADAESVYTISGVRVNGKNLQKGIYIVNGKKVVLK